MKRRPVNKSSRTLPIGMLSRVKKAPPAAITPRSISGTAKKASSDATRMSQNVAITKPTPTACMLRAAITGRLMLRSAGRQSSTSR